MNLASVAVIGWEKGVVEWWKRIEERGEEEETGDGRKSETGGRRGEEEY